MHHVTNMDTQRQKLGLFDGTRYEKIYPFNISNIGKDFFVSFMCMILEVKPVIKNNS